MPNHISFHRRSMLASAAASAGLAFLHSTQAALPAAAAAKRSPMPPRDLKKKIQGPIMSIPTPFTAEFAVDYQAVRNLVRQGLDHGIIVYELTAGDSKYAALSYEEIKELTRVLVEAVGDKGTVIAATGAWWTQRAVEYARYAESVGADGVQVLLPGSGSEDTYVAHYREIADATKLGIILHGNFPLPLVGRLTQIESVVGMKEDVSEKYYYDIQRKFGQRLAIFGGGQKWRFLIGHRYGSKGYLSTFSTFAPQIAVRFWKALQRGDLSAAHDIVLKYDQPLFDFCLSGKRPFFTYWHGIMECFGVTKRYLRPPAPSCDEEDMREVRAFVKTLAL